MADLGGGHGGGGVGGGGGGGVGIIPAAPLDPVEMRRLNFQTPGMISHPPIPISQLAEHIERLKANDNQKFSQEYEVCDFFLIFERGQNNCSWGITLEIKYVGECTGYCEKMGMYQEQTKMTTSL